MNGKWNGDSSHSCDYISYNKLTVTLVDLYYTYKFKTTIVHRHPNNRR